MSMVLSFKVVVRLRMVKFSYNFETLTILLIKSMSIRQASTSCLIRVGSHTQNRYVVFDCSVHHATYRRVSRVCIFKSQDPKRLKIDTTTYQRMATSFIVRVRTSWCTWCSSAKRENFNNFSLSCFFYVNQITRISLVSLTNAVQEYRLKINARMHTR